MKDFRKPTFWFHTAPALFLILACLGVIAFAPEGAIDPWGIFVPRKWAYIVITLSGLELIGYFLSKVVGEKRGSIALGFLGGFASSTAVLLSAAKTAKKYPMAWRTQLCSALAAKISALFEVLVIVSLTSRELLMPLKWPLGLAVLFALIALLILSEKNEGHHPILKLRPPLDLKGVLRLSLILAVVLVLISVSKLWFGEKGPFVISFFTGLFELHGVSFATASLHNQNTLDTNSAVNCILLATIGSLMAKTTMAWFINRDRFARSLAGLFFAMGGVIILVKMIT